MIHPPERIHKEVTLPTHLEKTMEEVDTDGYRVEYVKLTPFEVGSAVYYRDAKKNKLYQKLKEGRIGHYVGRYDAPTESIVTDVPDSDDDR